MYIQAPLRFFYTYFFIPLSTLQINTLNFDLHNVSVNLIPF